MSVINRNGRVQVYLGKNLFAKVEQQMHGSDNMSQTLKQLVKDGLRYRESADRFDKLLLAERASILASVESLYILRDMADRLEEGIADRAKQEARDFISDKWNVRSK